MIDANALATAIQQHVDDFHTQHPKASEFEDTGSLSAKCTEKSDSLTPNERAKRYLWRTNFNPVDYEARDIIQALSELCECNSAIMKTRTTGDNGSTAQHPQRERSKL